MKTWLLNNCRNIDHSSLYAKPDAFFDLWTKDHEGRKAREMAPGDVCYVLSQDSNRRIVVQRFVFGLIEEHPHVASGGRAYALRGRFVSGQVLTREDAQAHEVYRYFFNINGDICQWSVNRYLSMAEATA